MADASDTAAAPRPPALYKQVVEALRRDLLEGVYPVGTQLPSEEELTQRFGMSRNTIREALRELRNNGLVTSRRGSGTTVAKPGSTASYIHDTGMLGDLYQYSRMRWDYAVQLERPDAALAARLETETDEEWLRIEGCRYPDGADKPAFWTQAYLRRDYAGVTRLLARGIPMYQLIEDMYGDRVTEVDQQIHGMAAPERVAERLGLAPGAAVIEIGRTYRIASGRIVELSSNIYPFDQFSLAIKLRRSPG
ncbi:GntR family transcriptional regulator [Pseudorhodoferax sp.]|uniref:GntR family transcriptional regulator n=1 Tax=Pseudorhodoferax sp. TaxID=1993553 RepID=UPI002DD695D4|nr:GntR family transcriptional regulator [Pseudorhodoferax sp.]